MNITENKKDALNLELSLQVEPADYADIKKKKLAAFRRQADIKGFRKGMVPMSLVEKMYGERALVDSVNDVISKSLQDYINENKIKPIGEPLPCEDQPQVEWKDGNSFSFKFDVAQNPTLDFEVSKSDEILSYEISVSDEAKAEMKKNILRQFGTLEETEAAKEEDFIIADLEQEGMKVEGAYIALRSVAEELRPAFVGIKVGSELNINVNECFLDENDRAALLKVKKEELATLNPEFKLTVVNVKTFVDAPMTQETFDKAFGEGVVKSEEEFDAKVAEKIASEHAQESDFRFEKDAREYLVSKAEFSLPEAFLKRWITLNNEDKFSAEEIDKQWPSFIEDYKWQLIREYLIGKLSVKIEQEDYLNYAKGYAAYQYSMYGMYDVPEAQLETFAQSMLSNENERGRILDAVENKKVFEALKAVVTLKKKKISVEDFRQLK